MADRGRFRFIRLAASLLFAGATLLALTPRAAAASAADITAYCAFSPSSNAGTFYRATDGDYATKWASAVTSSRHIDFTVSGTREVGGVYCVWRSAPAQWELFAMDGDKQTSVAHSGSGGYLTQALAVPAPFGGRRKFRLVMTPASASAAVELAEIVVLGVGAVPDYMPRWQPFDGRADLLTIVAHPDDEDLYMGVPAPTYANQGLKCQTVFMTYGSASTSVRRYEAQESAWALGNRWYPAMGNFRDVKTTTLQEAMAIWPLEQVLSFLVEQIRRYKPSVIVTHDVNGEYGHGAHKLTQYAVKLAFQYAADPDRYPESARQYGTWKAGKLYVHLYAANALQPMSLTDTLGAFGGRTVLQVIADAYARHKSQLVGGGRSLPTSGPYDMRKFGLMSTRLGADATRLSMFENVSGDAMLALNPWYNFVVVDREPLAQALALARSKQQAHYVPESWQAANLPPVIAAAQAVMDNREATQAQVNTQVTKLLDAMGKLRLFILTVEVADPPDRQTYLAGEPLDLSGLVLSATMSDGSRQVLPVAPEDVSGYDSAVPLTGQTVTVAHGDKSATFTVDIVPADGERLASVQYAIDRTGWFIRDISLGTTVEQLKAAFTNEDADIRVFDRGGNEAAGGAVVTGMTVRLFIDGAVSDGLRLSVLGEVSGDGAIDIHDILYIRADIVDTYALKSYQVPAADVSGDGLVDIHDILYIRAHILGTYHIQSNKETSP